MEKEPLAEGQKCVPSHLLVSDLSSMACMLKSKEKHFL